MCGYKFTHRTTSGLASHHRGAAQEEEDGARRPGEERGNEIGKVVIAHGSVEFCEATPIGLADESKESLYERGTDQDLRNADRVAPRHTCRCVA